MNKKYNLKLSKKVEKFLFKNIFVAKNFYRQVNVLINSPFDNSLDIKKIQWSEKNYRLRIWKYRFLYEIIDNEILIYFYDAGSRWDIYK